MTRRILLSVFCALITASAFAAAYAFGWTWFDDGSYMTDLICRGVTAEGIAFAFTDIKECIYQPLVYLSYMADFSTPFGYQSAHVQSILWHSLNAGLLFALLVRLVVSRCGTQRSGVLALSFLATLVWSVHPLRVESVVWLASRKDVISTFFFLVALLLWTETGAKPTQSFVRPLLALFSIAVGTLAKPSVMVFPAFAVAIDLFITGRRKRKGWYAAAVLLGAAVAIEATWAQGHGASSFSAYVPLWYRLINSLAALTVYVGNFLCPTALAMQCMIRYPFAPMYSPLGLFVLLAWMAAAALWLLRKLQPLRKRGLADWAEDLIVLLRSQTGLLLLVLPTLALVTLVPFLGISGFGQHAFADRFTILPAIAISMLVAIGMALIVEKRSAVIAFSLYGIVCVFVVFLFMRTQIQTELWRDNARLLEHTLRVDSERNVMIHLALGVHYWSVEHDMEKVFRHLSAAQGAAWCDLLKEQCCEHGAMFVEAAYATSHDAEAEDAYFNLVKWNRRYSEQGGMMLEYAFADVLYEMHTGKSREEKLRIAADYLKEMQRKFPDKYPTGNLAYLIEKWRGNETAAVSQLSKMAEAPASTKNLNGAWARKLLGWKSPEFGALRREKDSAKLAIDNE